MNRSSTAALILTALLAVPPVQAQDFQPDDSPVLLQADEVVHDRDLNVVTARGHVEIAQSQRVLLADTVSYNLKTDIITASGNVALLEPTGEVVFADWFELKGDLKDGVARHIRMRLADQSRVAAASGRRVGGTRNELNKVVYSPCEPCKDKPEAELLWQVKAEEMVHDQTAKDIEYYNVRMEMFGVPVFYTPYFSHPDPTVKRRSGFLAPTLGKSSSLGSMVQVPYYWVISPHQDLTFAPIFTLDEGVVAFADHRARFTRGETRTQLSGTVDSAGEWRGHIKAEGRFHLDETWRAGYEVDRATDDTYLKRYGFERGKPWLVSRPWLEGFWRRSYALAEGFSFQGLRAGDDPGKSPLVLPHVVYDHVSEPGLWGGQWNATVDALSLSRGEGADTRRISLRTGWELPYLSPAGEFYTFSASLRSDLYRVSDFPGAGDAETTGRVFPEVALDWRWPFMRDHGTVTEILEPRVLAVLSPYGHNPDAIPNEDSRDAWLDDTNLFETNRFTGLDRVESGPRVAYGLEWGLYGDKGGYTSIMLGQMYRLHADRSFGIGRGIDDNFSDYVGRITVSPRNWVDLSYHFRFDKDDLNRRYDEAILSVGSDRLRLTTSYLFLDSPPDQAEFPDREELSARLAARFGRYWSGSVFGRWDLGIDPGPLQTGLQVVYDDECFTLAGSFIRNHTHDRDLDAGDTVLLRLVFKTLGEVPVSLM